MRTPTLRSKQRSQAVVEFGIVALTFTLLMFAVVDLGILLNSWVALSGATRDVGRAASLGYRYGNLQELVNNLPLPGTSRNADIFNAYCCGENGANDKLVLNIDYYSCIPGPACTTPMLVNQIDPNYWFRTGPNGHGTCPPAGPPCHPLPNDFLVISLTAPGMEVITPLVRPFFGCNGNSLHCYVRLGSTAMMRYEGR